MAKNDDHLPRIGRKGAGNCFTCQAKNQTEWCALDEEDLRHLNQAKTTNIYRKGQVLFYQGNPCLGIYCIESGTIALRISDSNGHEVISRLYDEGQTLGYAAHFGQGVHEGTAEALSDARVCFVDRSALRGLLNRAPALGHEFLGTMARELRDSERARLEAATLPMRARVAHLLLVLKDRFAEISDDGILTIELPISRTDLAAMVGARPETISRVIKQLEEANVARFKGRKVIVEDLDSLLDEIELV